MMQINGQFKINEQWAVECGSQEWVLTETYEGLDKDKRPKMHTRESYHPTLDFAMRYAADRSCQGVESIKDIEHRYMALIHALSDRTRPLERGYWDIHAQLLDARREAVELRKQVKRLERVAV